MPRKPKFTKEDVLRSACEVARQKGIEEVTAASVAANMGYTGSSLFTHYESMNEIKREVYAVLRREAVEMLSESLEYSPAFKELGLRMIRLAKAQPHVYRMLFISNPYGESILWDGFADVSGPMEKEIAKTFGLSSAEARSLITACVIQANGIASFVLNGYGDEFGEDSVSRRLSEVCLGMVMLIKTGNGSLTPEMARAMSAAPDNMPARKQAGRNDIDKKE